MVLCWLSVCGGEQHSETSTPAEVPVPLSFVPALLRAGLVASRLRSWLLFADTTRQELFRLGRTHQEVRGWLADYEKRLEQHLTLNPDSVHLLLPNGQALCLCFEEWVGWSAQRLTLGLKHLQGQLGTPANLTAEAQGLAIRQQNACTHEANRQATALILDRLSQGLGFGIIRLRSSWRVLAFALAAGAALPTNKYSA